jgi:hypothetical protein
VRVRQCFWMNSRRLDLSGDEIMRLSMDWYKV